MTTALTEFEAKQSGKEKIRKSLQNLAIARQAEFEDASQRVYLHLLEDLDPALIARACREWALKPREAFAPTMPSAADLRASVTELARQDAHEQKLRSLPPAPVSEDHEPRFFCPSCRDEANGWRPFWCPGIGSARSFNRPDRAIGSVVDCGRQRAHSGHDYVTKCECWGRNPVVERLKERELRRKVEKRREAYA